MPRKQNTNEIREELQKLNNDPYISKFKRSCISSAIEFYRQLYNETLNLVSNSEDRNFFEQIHEREKVINSLKAKIALYESMENKRIDMNNTEIIEKAAKKIELFKTQVDETMKNKIVEMRCKLNMEHLRCDEKLNGVLNDLEKEKKLREITEESAKRVKVGYEEALQKISVFIEKHDAQIVRHREIENKLRAEIDKKQKENVELKFVKRKDDSRLIYLEEKIVIKSEIIGHLRNQISQMISTKNMISKINDTTFLREIESLANAYDDSCTNLLRIERMLEERDNQIDKMKEERLEFEKKIEVLISEVNNLKERLDESLKSSIDEKNMNFMKLTGDFENRKAAAIFHKNNFLSCCAEKKSLERKLKLNESVKDSLILKLDEINSKSSEAQTNLEIEREENKNIKNLLNSLTNGKFMENISEVDNYRKLLRCNVCDKRFKDTVINKCMHVFCSVCIEQRIAMRNRKCPHCCEVFNTNDIKRIFL